MGVIDRAGGEKPLGGGGGLRILAVPYVERVFLDSLSRV